MKYSVLLVLMLAGLFVAQGCESTTGPSKTMSGFWVSDPYDLDLGRGVKIKAVEYVVLYPDGRGTMGSSRTAPAVKRPAKSDSDPFYVLRGGKLQLGEYDSRGEFEPLAKPVEYHSGSDTFTMSTEKQGDIVMRRRE